MSCVCTKTMKLIFDYWGGREHFPPSPSKKKPDVQLYYQNKPKQRLVSNFGIHEFDDSQTQKKIQFGSKK